MYSITFGHKKMRHGFVIDFIFELLFVYVKHFLQVVCLDSGAETGGLSATRHD